MAPSVLPVPLLRVGALRTANAFQLAAALLWSLGKARGRHCVFFDERLRDAAAMDGFSIAPEQPLTSNRARGDGRTRRHSIESARRLG
jgi:hypothetical protein